MGLLLAFVTAEDTIRKAGNQVFRNVLCTAIFCGVGDLGSKFRETSQYILLKGEGEKTK